MENIILLIHSAHAKYRFKIILLKMYDAPKFCGNKWEKDLLPALFNGGIWVWRHISRLCSGPLHTFVSMRAAYKRQHLPNYKQIPAKWRAIVKRKWRPLCASRSTNQAVWSQCTSNTSNRFPWKLERLVEALH